MNLNGKKKVSQWSADCVLRIPYAMSAYFKNDDSQINENSVLFSCSVGVDGIMCKKSKYTLKKKYNITKMPK